MSIEQLQGRKEGLLIFQQDYEDVKNLIKDFPAQQKPSLIPYGNVAFLEGKFERPDHILVSLGAEYFAEYNSAEALSVLARRQQMITDMLRDVEDEIEIYELTQKLQIFDKIKDDEIPFNGEGEGAAIDIREEWTPQDERLYEQGKGKVVNSPQTQPEEKQKKKVTFSPVPAPPRVPVKPIVKERIVERKSGKPTADLHVTATVKQAKESFFRKSLRKDVVDKSEGKETFSPQ